MDQPVSRQLIDQFLSVVANGTEEEARAFLIGHLREFPEEGRDEIIAAFVEEAIKKTAADDVLMTAFKKEGLATAAAMTDAKKELDKQARMNELKKDL